MASPLELKPDDLRRDGFGAFPGEYGISIDEINKIWTKVYSYENK